MPTSKARERIAAEVTGEHARRLARYQGQATVGVGMVPEVAEHGYDAIPWDVLPNGTLAWLANIATSAPAFTAWASRAEAMDAIRARIEWERAHGEPKSYAFSNTPGREKREAPLLARVCRVIAQIRGDAGRVGINRSGDGTPYPSEAAIAEAREARMRQAGAGASATAPMPIADTPDD